MAFGVILPGGTKTAPAAPSPVSQKGKFSVLLPEDRNRARQIAEMQKEAATVRRDSQKANSLGSLATETVKGLPRAALDLTKTIIGDTVGATLTPIQAGVSALTGKGPVKLPPLKSPLGDIEVETAQARAQRYTEEGDNVPMASAKAFGSFIIDEPLGLAAKPLLIAGGVALRVASKIFGKKTVPEVIEALHTELPQMPPKQAASIAPHIAEAQTPKEVQEILQASSTMKPQGTKVAPKVVPVSSSETIGKPAIIPEAPKAKSKVGQSIESKAIEKKLTEGFEDGTAGYDPITIKDQSERVSKLINEDIDTARAIVRGEKELPKELRGASLITGLEEHALQKGDVAMLRELANSPLASETSKSAQELRILAERNPDSPVSIIKDISKARQTAADARIKGGSKKAKTATVKEIKGEIEKANKKQTWDSFVDSVTCPT